MKKLILGVALVLLGSNSAFALSLQEAKIAGLIGERNDGYVGYVVTPPKSEVKAVVKQVNNKRREKFISSAKSNNLETDQVARRFYQRAVKATVTGNYYQSAGGVWIKK